MTDISIEWVRFIIGKWLSGSRFETDGTVDDIINQLVANGIDPDIIFEYTADSEGMSKLIDENTSYSADWLVKQMKLDLKLKSMGNDFD